MSVGQERRIMLPDAKDNAENMNRLQLLAEEVCSIRNKEEYINYKSITSRLVAHYSTESICANLQPCSKSEKREKYSLELH